MHLASAENRLDVVKDNVRCLHSTTKARGALHDEPLDLTISCLNFKLINSILITLMNLLVPALRKDPLVLALPETADSWLSGVAAIVVGVLIGTSISR